MEPVAALVTFQLANQRKRKNAVSAGDNKNTRILRVLLLAVIYSIESDSESSGIKQSLTGIHR
jgi:hypothetical protein